MLVAPYVASFSVVLGMDDALMHLNITEVTLLAFPTIASSLPKSVSQSWKMK